MSLHLVALRSPSTVYTLKIFSGIVCIVDYLWHSCARSPVGVYLSIIDLFPFLWDISSFGVGGECIFLFLLSSNNEMNWEKLGV